MIKKKKKVNKIKDENKKENNKNDLDQ